MKHAHNSARNPMRRVILCAVVCSCTMFAHAGTTYRITDLSALAPPNNESLQLTALNNSGQLAGSYVPSGLTASHALIYESGIFTDLGTGSGLSAQVSSINASGQIAGVFGVGTPQQQNSYAFIGTGTSFTSLGALTPGYQSTAASLNDSGQVTGVSLTTNSGNYNIDEQSRHAFLYSNGVMSDLGTLQGAGYSYGTGINNAGQVIGVSYVGVPAGALPGNYEHAFLYSSGAMVDLTPPGVLLSYANAINEAGNIAGALETDVPLTAGGPIQTMVQPALYANGTWTGIGSAIPLINQPAAATALNNIGQVVGYFPSGPFIYSNGTLQNLQSLVDPTNPIASLVTLKTPLAINDNSWILVSGGIGNSAHFFLLTPETLIITPAPLDFGAQPIGMEAPTQTVTVMNNGAAAVSLSGISITGGFSQTNNCPTSLASSASCTFDVGFTPSAVAPATGGLSLTAGGLEHIVALAGSGTITLTMSASPTTVTAGVASTLTWTGTDGMTCTASDGSGGDGWLGTQASSGSKAVTEYTQGTFTYTLSCTESGESVQAQAVVKVLPMASSGGGGGSTDVRWIVILLSLSAIKILRSRRRIWTIQECARRRTLRVNASETSRCSAREITANFLGS